MRTCIHVCVSVLVSKSMVCGHAYVSLCAYVCERVECVCVVVCVHLRYASIMRGLLSTYN